MTIHTFRLQCLRYKSVTLHRFTCLTRYGCCQTSRHSDVHHGTNRLTPISTLNTGPLLQVGEVPFPFSSHSQSFVPRYDQVACAHGSVHHDDVPTRDVGDCGQVLRCLVQQSKSELYPEYQTRRGDGVCGSGSVSFMFGFVMLIVVCVFDFQEAQAQ